ncbi:MAG TPA: peroxiredoxin [Gammaproteobacteria bacterium]
MAKVSVGKPVPAFEAQATSGTTVSSKKLAGTPYVLYFYPKDATPGCTTEGQAFRDLHREFDRLGVAVFGVSRDSLASHEKFKAAQRFPFELISDPDERLCRLFDVIREKNMYGRKVLGVERSTFLIDGDGVLRREWRKVRVKGHAEEVLAAARELG